MDIGDHRKAYNRGPGNPVCGTMFGLQTPDGRAELRRHRLFETSWPIALRPACQHVADAITITGHSYHTWRLTASYRHRTGNGPDPRGIFTIDDARHAMGIDWMSMKDLSQAIPPAYAEWIGRQALLHLGR